MVSVCVVHKCKSHLWASAGGSDHAAQASLEGCPESSPETGSERTREKTKLFYYLRNSFTFAELDLVALLQSKRGLIPLSCLYITVCNHRQSNICWSYKYMKLQPGDTQLIIKTVNGPKSTNLASSVQATKWFFLFICSFNLFKKRIVKLSSRLNPPP